jgi:hypothetical protein
MSCNLVIRKSWKGRATVEYTCYSLLGQAKVCNWFWIETLYFADRASWTILVQQPTQYTNSVIYFAVLPYMFRAYIQLIINRLRVKCGKWWLSPSMSTVYGPEWSGRSILAHRQSKFKETITIFHILHVASWWWAACKPETCKTKTKNKLLNWCTVLVIVQVKVWLWINLKCRVPKYSSSQTLHRY